MEGTRALFASIGASVTLVAAAALSLLAVSAVFAFGGWSDPAVGSIDRPALIFAGSTLSDSDGAREVVRTASADPIVVAPPATSPRRRESARSADTGSRAVRAPEPPATSKPTNAATSTPTLNKPKPHPVAPPPPPAVTKAKQSGDGVRKVGEDLSGAVQGTGAALADATQPLSAPISAAVQQVFNAVAAVLTQTTTGLGTALDKILPRK